ncbi:hypothetical protein G7Y89_g1862 [Cudoniella acicularis]|uniref:N-acetyltransferase domain-containing protein n=1 Tax=Cudoniella acicularis TaxID=354080 RepID=A0A8H4W6K7_9HELO|nr:hypothetical protein G7Y89_g1862 [Cudoniella acicularis]
MSYSIQLATEADLHEMTEVMVAALSDDSCWQGMKGSWTDKEEYEFTLETLRVSMNGSQAGAYKCWKVIDKNGKILAWAGLGYPSSLGEEQKNWVITTTTYQIPPGRNQKILEFFRNSILLLPMKHGYDNAKHFQYQRRGLGRLLTEKCNEVADASRAATYVRAQSKAAGLFIQMGYEVLEKIDFDLCDFGANLKDGKTSVFVMKREPGAKEQQGRRFPDWIEDEV